MASFVSVAVVTTHNNSWSVGNFLKSSFCAALSSKWVEDDRKSVENPQESTEGPSKLAEKLSKSAEGRQELAEEEK